MRFLVPVTPALNEIDHGNGERSRDTRTLHSFRVP